MWISTISRPGALYGASASAQTFETIEESTINPSGFEEIIDVTLARAIGEENYSHMPGFEEFGRKSKKDANRANLMKKIKGRRVGNPFRSPKFGVFAKTIKKLKSGG